MANIEEAMEPPLPLTTVKWRGKLKRSNLKKAQGLASPMIPLKRNMNPDQRQRIISSNLVTSANTLFNPLCQLVPGYQVFKYLDPSDGQFRTIHLICRRCGDLKDTERDACFKMVEESWKNSSETPPTWSKIQKWREMFDFYNAWFILCRSKDGLHGFAHFRFEVQLTKAVVKCKDLYLSQVMQGKGLGRRLMQFQIDLAKKVRMDLVAVTVPHFCSSTVPFFNALGFEQRDRTFLNESLENVENFVPSITLWQSISP